MKKKMYLTIALLVLAAGGLLFFNAYLYSRIRQASGSFAQIRLRDAEIRKKAEFAPLLKKEKEALGGYPAALEASFFQPAASYAASNKFNRMLEELASTTAVTIQKRSIDAYGGSAAASFGENGGGERKTHVLSLDLRGSYAGILRFLTGIEYSQPLMRVENIDLEGGSPRGRFIVNEGGGRSSSGMQASVTIGLFEKS